MISLILSLFLSQPVDASLIQRLKNWCANQRDGFKSGAQFVLDNPPPEVEALVESIDLLLKDHGLPPTVCLVKISEALAQFRKGDR